MFPSDILDLTELALLCIFATKARIRVPAGPQGDLSRLEASAAHAGELFQGTKWLRLATERIQKSFRNPTSVNARPEKRSGADFRAVSEAYLDTCRRQRLLGVGGSGRSSLESCILPRRGLTTPAIEWPISMETIP